MQRLRQHMLYLFEKFPFKILVFKNFRQHYILELSTAYEHFTRIQIFATCVETILCI